MTDMKGTSGMRLNVGCGTRGLAGWINIDYSPRFRFRRLIKHAGLFAKLGLLNQDQAAEFRRTTVPPGFLFHDITKGLPFPDGVADFVYCSEVIEHLEKHQGKTLLSEIYRVLKRGGLARITTPDMRMICEQYLSGRLGFHVPPDARPGSLADPFNYGVRTTVLQSPPPRIHRFTRFVSRRTKGHVYLYDRNELSWLMDSVGFRDITFHAIREGEFPELAGLEEGHEYTGRSISMYAEASK